MPAQYWLPLCVFIRCSIRHFLSGMVIYIKMSSKLCVLLPSIFYSTFSLADQMRLLNYAQWMKLLQNVFDSLLVLLKRVKVRSLSHNSEFIIF